MEGFKIEDLPIHIVNDRDLAEATTSGTYGFPRLKVNTLSDSESAGSDDNSLDDGDNDDMSEKSSANTKKKRKPVSKLSATLKGLMGEANVRCARGDVETAEKMCFQVIREAPEAYEPYLLLSQIYETRDTKKYGIYLTLATHLNRSDVDSWCRLADYYCRENKIKDAIDCYRKAIKVQPCNIELHLHCIALAQKLEDTKMVLAFKVRLASKLPRRDYEEMIQIVKNAVKEYHTQKLYDKAILALEIPFKRIPNNVTQDLVNMMLELLLITNRYSQCLDILTQFCGFDFDLTVNDDMSVNLNSYNIPPGVEIDIRAKFMVCVIKTHSLHLIPHLLDEFLQIDDAEKIGDLYLDIAEALMNENCFDHALKLLVPLVKSKNYSLAAVWLKYAECLSHCNMLEQAVEAYFTVMALAPQHVEVLYPLAMLLLKLDKKSEALAVLSQDTASTKLDVAVLIERMRLLKQIDDVEGYFKCADILLGRHSVLFRNPEEIRVAATFPRSSERVSRIKKMREIRLDPVEPIATVECIRELSVEEEYRVFKEILQYAKEKKQYANFQKFAFMGLTSKRFESYYSEMLLIAYFACLYNKDTYHGFVIIRDIVLHNTKNNLAWNLFNLLIQGSEEIRHTKFINRLQLRLPMKGLEIIDANNELTVNSTSGALKFYMKEFKKYNSPYLAFMLGVITLQMCNQRNSLDKKKMTEAVLSLFLTYSKTRSRSATLEIYYNLGRMYHQLGKNDKARFYYLKVLASNNEHSPALCLKHEAAYNLHVIYKNSGSLIEARNVLLQYARV